MTCIIMSHLGNDLMVLFTDDFVPAVVVVTGLMTVSFGDNSWHVFTDIMFFFFSSRRRHTRSLCDWSSDVCSSDLIRLRRGGLLRGPPARSRSDRRDIQRRDATDDLEYLQMRLAADFHDRVFRHRQPPALQPFLEPRLRSEERRVGKGCRSRGVSDA